MKKFFVLLFVPLLVFGLFSGVGQAATTPIYDATFDNNTGALFANGIAVTIEEVAGNTVATWEGGSVNLPATARVFGGGKAGETYDTSHIILKSGTVKAIYGGGLLYTTTEKSNVTIGGGAIGAVLGGGSAAAAIDGIVYAAGTEDHPENSFSRVNNAYVLVTDGTLDTLWGGGQGYSYVGKTFVKVSGSPVINYVTAAGSNGYTGEAEVEIVGGEIGTYQTVNRGSLPEAVVRISGGTIDRVFVGGEDAADVTGTVSEIEFDVLGGDVVNLYAGKSNNAPLDLTKPSYELVVVSRCRVV